MKGLRLYFLLLLLPGVQAVSFSQSWTAYLSSNDTDVCLGDSVAAYIFINGGISPWDVVIKDIYGDSIVLNDIYSPHTVWLKPEVNNTYEITSVVDSDEKPGKESGTVTLIVHQATPVTIDIDRSIFLESEPGYDLVSSPPGAYFSGVGVSANRFYPAVAGSENSPHLITCIYTNAFGCVSIDETDLYVLSGNASVVLESGGVTVIALCDDDAVYLMRGSNDDGIPGTFELLEAASATPVPGHISDANLNDNEAVLDPTGLSGAYDIEYSYSMGALTVRATFRFLVNDLGDIRISGLPDIVCKNDDPYLLIPELVGEDPSATYAFSGPGVSGNMSDGYYFDPENPGVPAGDTEIGIEYTSSNGCRTTTSQTVYSSFVPAVGFLLSTACIPAGGGSVSFNNITGSIPTVALWAWDFDDPESGADNTSNLENPTHFYSEPGFRSISLTATTYDGCVANYSQDTVLVDQPEADFTMISDCFVGGERTELMDRSVSTLAGIDTLVWTFRTVSGDVLGVIGSGSSGDTIKFQFNSMDRYRVDLHVENETGCSGDLTREILLRPVVVVPEAGYMEDFNSGDGGWMAMSVDQNQSWVLDIPDFTGFTPVQGDLAWYTDLPDHTPGYVEESWVQSPCYDMGNLSAALIQMDIMKSFAPGTDGAVVQFQDYVSEGWKTVGQVGDGGNWYNESGIDNQPGGEDFGWGLALFEPDEMWLNAGHAVSNTGTFPYGKFRVITATGGKQAVGNQGFAFDNFFVGERLRYSVLEYFTSSSSGSAFNADELVDAFGSDHAGNVIDLQYHMDYPGEDPMYENNPTPTDARSFIYGVNFVPYAVLNGGTDQDTRFNFLDPSQEPDAAVLAEEALEAPKFDIRLEVEYHANSLDCQVRVTCTADTFASGVQLYIAVIESEITAYTGLNQDTSFRNVVLDIIPNNSTGVLLEGGWNSSKSVTLNYNWDYPPFLEDKEDLAVVAFISNRGGDDIEVLQATVAPYSGEVGLSKSIPFGTALKVYPNPAGDALFVNFGHPLEREGELEITDISGRRVIINDVQPGYTIQQLDVSKLTRGIYMIMWRESGAIKARSRIIISR